VMLGIATLTSFGINAAVFGMVAHGLITGMLFFLAGSVQERFGTRELSRLGGLLLQAPRLGWILGFCAMASLGLPGLAGFWGEFPAILSAYQPAAGLSEVTFRVFMVVASVGTVFAAASGFKAPYLDYHALAPEIILTGTIVLVLLADALLDESRKWVISNLAGWGLLASLFLVLELGAYGHHASMVGGAYVVDDFSLVFKALFLVVAYVVLLMSTNYVEEGDYYQGEFYFLLLCSLLGMVVMGSARDLITIFVALETLSLPAYMLAGWRKRDLKSNEAALKYYLLGVLASAVMLYGMSLIFGQANSTVLVKIGDQVRGSITHAPLVTLGIFFITVGFAFKVSAVPFHFWAPDTYEGA